MVVGTYRMTNFNGETIPPGIIDHKEWTPENGRNNALRINGLGAPRAFYTPMLRTINFPTTKYGEDKREVTRDHENHITTVMRTITKIKKLYDVSAVSLPANDATSISARKFTDGVIGEIKAERLKRANTAKKIKLTLLGV